MFYQGKNSLNCARPKCFSFLLITCITLDLVNIMNCLRTIYLQKKILLTWRNRYDFYYPHHASVQQASISFFTLHEKFIVINVENIDHFDSQIETWYSWQFYILFICRMTWFANWFLKNICIVSFVYCIISKFFRETLNKLQSISPVIKRIINISI